MQKLPFILFSLITVMIGLGASVLLRATKHAPSAFSGDKAFAIIAEQVTLGPRHLSVEGHTRVQEFLQKELAASTADVILQRWTHTAADGRRIPLMNIVARFYPEREERIILATHYDTNPSPETPGANNGASGVAVLLELARVLVANSEMPSVGIDFVFFDGEEGEEGVKRKTWRPLGSEYFVSHLEEMYTRKKPRQGIVVDMVCERGATITPEQTSLRDAPDAVRAFWRVARGIAPEVFLDMQMVGILDDHTALNAAGIPSILLIDFEYPWIYSLDDTPDKCSAQSLQSVGDALFEYIAQL